jgi:hypothetical protein
MLSLLLVHNILLLLFILYKYKCICTYTLYILFELLETSAVLSTLEKSIPVYCVELALYRD